MKFPDVTFFVVIAQCGFGCRPRALGELFWAVTARKGGAATERALNQIRVVAGHRATSQS